MKQPLKKLECSSNNKPHVFASFDRTYYKCKEIKNTVLWNTVKYCMLEITGAGSGILFSNYFGGFIIRRLEM